MYKYDVRLTIRDAEDKTGSYILKQYYLKNVEFPNPVCTGDKLILSEKNNKDNTQFFMKNLEVFHTPKPHESSVIYVEENKYENNLKSIEKIISQYDFFEF